MKKILVIDDNPRNNSAYINDLKKYYDVDLVMRLHSAERLLASTSYDAIIIDVMMPTQYLNSDDEMTTGFVFYKEAVTRFMLKCPVVFWSRLEIDSYTEFWSNNPPKNTFFLHKEEDDDSFNHLTSFVNKLF